VNAAELIYLGCFNTWFQLFNLKSDNPISILCVKNETCTATPGRHPDVVQERRKRSVTPVPGAIRAGGAKSPFLDDKGKPSAAALAAAAKRRATYGGAVHQVAHLP
jgi:hypothetical protein